MKNPMQKKAEAKNNLGQSIIGFIDSINLGATYVTFGLPVFNQFALELAKSILFPIAIAMSLFQAIFAWRQANIDRGKQRSTINAAVETVSALAITTAVIGILVASAAFVLATPIIFTAVAAAKTLFHVGASIYYHRQSKTYTNPLKTSDQIEKKKDTYFELSKQHAIGAVAGAVATLATAAVFLLGKLAFAGIGMGLAIVGVCFAVYKGYHAAKALKETPPDDMQKAERKPGLSSQPMISKRLDIDLIKQRKFTGRPASSPSKPIATNARLSEQTTNTPDHEYTIIQNTPNTPSSYTVIKNTPQ